MDSEQSLCHATFVKYSVIRSVCDRLRVREKRRVFNLMRSHQGCNEDSFMARDGYTIGEFAVFQVLSDTGRRSLSENSVS